MADDLQISIGADPSGLGRDLARAQGMISNFASQVQRIGEAGEALSSLGQKLTVSLTLPIVGLGAAAIKAYGELQALELGIESVAGSASYAAKEMEDLKEIAKLPGLGLKEAAKGSVGLQAIGYSAGNAEKILKEFGNAIATVGKGRVEFERAIYGVQQLANTDFPLGEDLNIIKDALPQVSTLLKAAFGTSRTEDLQKLKISSQQVMEVIIDGLGKLPRVSGGVKNAFENLKDSMQQSLARIGELIDKNFDISGIINKLTDLIDKAISKFEGLSKPVQELVLIFAGLAAATGPVLLGIGGILALLPTLVNGFVAVRTAVVAFNTAMLTNPYLAAGAAILSLVSAFAIYKSSVETAADRTERWNESLDAARANARVEISNLDALYKKTQDHTIALEERNAAVDQIQKEYPYYFANLTDEAIKAGQAAGQYKELRAAILNASLARAAQKELDTRSEAALKRELEVRKKFTALYQIQKTNNSEAIKGFIKDYENALTTSEKLLGGIANPFANSALQSDAEIKEAAKRAAKSLLNSFTSELKAANLENKPLLDMLKRGSQDVENLDVPAANNFLPGLTKVKKETEKQLSEIFPKGSIAELQQRADLLKKAIYTSVNDIVKVRGLDKFGKETDKKGQPFFTGETLSLQDAKNQLEQLLAQISLLEVKPPQVTADFKIFRETFANEIEGLKKSASDIDFDFTGNTNPFEKITNNINSLAVSIGKVQNFNSSISTTLRQMSTDVSSSINTIGDSFLSLPKTIGFGIDSSKIKAQELTKLTERFNSDASNLLNQEVINGVSNAMGALGNTIAAGGNVVEALGMSLLSSVGSILIELGKQAIAAGVGLLAITTALKSLNPYVALAAGAALIALGSVVKGSVSKIGSSMGSGGSSGSVSTSTGANYSGNTYSSNYTSGGSSNNEVIFRISGSDLVGVLNRENQKNNRLNAS
ncbi:tape measure protein [Chryseobacterium indologenes]|uniref:Tape measure protein N-terminal domain-containing protein n=1 Tax=Chryseobacterium indologenes TaxID=253 RepID=A0A0N0ZWG2_CHRID|nr:tape measure protein [Chryseobacterium indologenes]KPE49769.1 hypothetical protein AOB46_18775 [Chryseobacterium indologenes]